MRDKYQSGDKVIVIYSEHRPHMIGEVITITGPREYIEISIFHDHSWWGYPTNVDNHFRPKENFLIPYTDPDAEIEKELEMVE